MYVQSNLVVPEIPFTLDADRVKNLTVEEFDSLSLSDQIHIFNEFRDVYDNLTGRSSEDVTSHGEEDSRTREQRFADEFEQRVDEILQRAFNPKGQ